MAEAPAKSGVRDGYTQSGLEIEFLQELCESFSREFGYMISVMAERREMDERAVSWLEMKRSKVMKQGVNPGIDYDGMRKIAQRIRGGLARPVLHNGTANEVLRESR